MPDTADDLLGDADDLIMCRTAYHPGPWLGSCGICSCCEWRQRYIRFKDEREKREAVEIAQRLNR